MRKLMIVTGVLSLILLAMLSVSPTANAQDGETATPYDGFTLYAPIGSTTTYLINMDGTVVYEWESDYRPGHSVYLLENGNLLRTGALSSQNTFPMGGGGGIVEEFTWDGDLVWSYTYATENLLLHHDIEPMPNGNILMIAWETKDEAEMLDAGRSANLMPSLETNENPNRPNANGGNGGNTPRNNIRAQSTDPILYVDKIIEVDPTTNEIVWEWHIWDHLVQDEDDSLPNYGVIDENLGKVDINFAPNPNRISADWNHTNGIDYNADLDQILLSVHNFNEIWIIDHDLTTIDAATSAGDLLYRWGNPAAYEGTGEQVLYTQHDAKWVLNDYPGAGNITIYNNGNQRTRPYSTVEEIAPPLNADGTYQVEQDVLVWNYTADSAESLFAERISGAQRLPNGNTLITEGTTGRVIEVTADGTVIWEYKVPSTGNRDMGIFRAERYAPDYPAFAAQDLLLSAD